MMAPTVATNNGDYMLTWATEVSGTATLWSLPLDARGDFKYSTPANQPSQVVEPKAFHSAAASAAVYRGSRS